MSEVSVVHLILGGLTLASALLVLLNRNPVVSAVMLMATLFLTGAMYFALGFYFIGAVQILIYAGAIAVLFVFIVMLLDLKPIFLRIPGQQIGVFAALVAGAVLLFGLAGGILPGSGGTAASGEALLSAASVKAVSLNFLSSYMLPFQVTGLLILGAVMGVTILGRPSSKGKSERP